MKKKKIFAYHNTIRLANRPKVDFLVISASHQNSSRFVTQGKTIYTGSMCHKFLCKKKIERENNMSNFKATYSTVVVRAKANVQPTGSKVLLGKFLSSIYVFVGCFLEIKGPHRRRPYKSLYRKNLKKKLYEKILRINFLHKLLLSLFQT